MSVNSQVDVRLTPVRVIRTEKNGGKCTNTT